MVTQVSRADNNNAATTLTTYVAGVATDAANAAKSSYADSMMPSHLISQGQRPMRPLYAGPSTPPPPPSPEVTALVSQLQGKEYSATMDETINQLAIKAAIQIVDGGTVTAQNSVYFVLASYDTTPSVQAKFHSLLADKLVSYCSVPINPEPADRPDLERVFNATADTLLLLKDALRMTREDATEVVGTLHSFGSALKGFNSEPLWGRYRYILTQMYNTVAKDDLGRKVIKDMMGERLPTSHVALGLIEIGRPTEAIDRVKVSLAIQTLSARGRQIEQLSDLFKRYTELNDHNDRSGKTRQSMYRVLWEAVTFEKTREEDLWNAVAENSDNLARHKELFPIVLEAHRRTRALPHSVHAFHPLAKMFGVEVKSLTRADDIASVQKMVREWQGMNDADRLAFATFHSTDIAAMREFAKRPAQMLRFWATVHCGGSPEADAAARARAKGGDTDKPDPLPKGGQLKK